MANAEIHEVLSVDSEKLLSVVSDYEKYPQFVDGCTSVRVERKSPECVRAYYQVSVMSQDVTYVLDHKEDLKSGKIEWSLVESNFFKKNNGKWEVKAAGSGKCDVVYTLDVEFKVPVPGFILNRLVKGSLPGMVKSFETRAKKSG